MTISLQIDDSMVAVLNDAGMRLRIATVHIKSMCDSCSVTRFFIGLPNKNRSFLMVFGLLAVLRFGTALLPYVNRKP